MKSPPFPRVRRATADTDAGSTDARLNHALDSLREERAAGVVAPLNTRPTNRSSYRRDQP